MVQCGHERPPVVHQSGDASTETLVVVDDVEVALACRQFLADAPAEGQRLRESGSAHERELGHVDAIAKFTGTRHPKRIRTAIEIERWHRNEVDSVIEYGIGLAREDSDVVAHGHQLAADIAGVDTLAAGVRITPIDEERDAQMVGCGGHERTRLAVTRPTGQLWSSASATNPTPARRQR